VKATDHNQDILRLSIADKHIFSGHITNPIKGERQQKREQYFLDMVCSIYVPFLLFVSTLLIETIEYM
jgi:hypothetical protein